MNSYMALLDATKCPLALLAKVWRHLWSIQVRSLRMDDDDSHEDATKQWATKQWATKQWAARVVHAFGTFLCRPRPWQRDVRTWWNFSFSSQTTTPFISLNFIPGMLIHTCHYERLGSYREILTNGKRRAKICVLPKVEEIELVW